MSPSAKPTSETTPFRSSFLSQAPDKYPRLLNAVGRSLVHPDKSVVHLRPYTYVRTPTSLALGYVDLLITRTLASRRSLNVCNHIE